VVQRQQNNSGTILLVVGALCIVIGFILFGNRVGLAETFLGAHSLFGIPLTNLDAAKVTAAAFGTGLLVLQGIVLAVVGAVQLSKSGTLAPPEETATSTNR